MSGVTYDIEIHGLGEIRRSLKEIDAKLPSELRKRMNRSAKIIVDEAKPRIPRVTGKAAGSVRASSTTMMARVSGGGGKVPYYGWLDFGGYGGRNKKAFRTFYSEGRYIYAAYFANRDRFFDDLEKGLVELTERAGLDVT